MFHVPVSHPCISWLLFFRSCSMLSLTEKNKHGNIRALIWKKKSISFFFIWKYFKWRRAPMRIKEKKSAIFRLRPTYQMYDAQIEMCKPCQTASFRLRFTTLFASFAYLTLALSKRNSRGFFFFNFPFFSLSNERFSYDQETVKEWNNRNKKTVKTVLMRMDGFNHWVQVTW